MKYVNEFRDGAVARGLVQEIAREANGSRTYSLMEFCGGHTHALCRYGLLDLLPPTVNMVHGPGCPVCVLPVGRLDQATALAQRPGVILCTFGDMMRVPGRNRLSLMRARAQGANVRMVFGSTDALAVARENPDKEVVFFAIGFETTTPTTAAAVAQAAAEDLRNFSVFVNHVLTPSAVDAILNSAESRNGTLRVEGLVGPGHVSAITGSQPYERFAREARLPVVISGFEPLDLLQSILMLVRQINAGRSEVETQYTRAVSAEGNHKAQALVQEVFELRDGFEWRGLGSLAHSALRLRPKYAAWDAEVKFDVPYEKVADHKACSCGAILKGLKRPTDCVIFGTGCTPDNPMGSCMVSPEGSCAAYFLYGRKSPSSSSSTSASRSA